jgi:hypothetical protein
VSDRQGKGKAVAVKERNRSPLNVFRSLARKTKGPYGAPKERLEPKARQSDARQVSGRQKGKLVGVEGPDWSPHNVFSSLARQTGGPIKSVEGTTRTQSPSKSCPPSERPTKDKVVGVKERNRSPLNVCGSLARKTKGPSGAPMERLEPKARQSHACQVSDRQEDEPAGVKGPDWSPLKRF